MGVGSGRRASPEAPQPYEKSEVRRLREMSPLWELELEVGNFCLLFRVSGLGVRGLGGLVFRV